MQELIMRVFLRICLIGLLFSTLLVDVDEKIAQEFIRGTALYVLLIALFVLTLYLTGKRDLAERYIPSLEQLALIAFALVSTVHAISHIVDTEIPRLKFFFRLLYGCYLIYVSSPWARRISRIGLITTTVLIFSSFLFNWTFIVGLIRSIPLLLVLLFFWLGTSRPILPWRDLRRDPFFLLISVALLSLVAANVWNANLLNGFEGVVRFLIGALVFSLIRNSNEEGAGSRVVRSLLIVAALHVLIFLVSVVIAASVDGSLSVFVSKRSHFAGVNVNDISGYLITVFPLIMSVMFVNGKDARKRQVALAILFFGCLFLLLVVKSRSAWPIMGLSIAFVAYFMSRWSRSGPEAFQRALRWIIPGAFVLGLIMLILVLYRAPDLAYLADFKTLEIRFDLWRLAMRALSEAPIFGSGSENYSVLSAQKILSSADLNSFAALGAFFRESGAYIHCHNLILQLWLDGGLVYMLGLVGLILFGIYMGMSRSHESPDFIIHIAASITLIAILLQGFLNYHFMNHPTWLTTWILLGIVSRRKDGDVKPEPEGREWPFAGAQVSAAFVGILFIALHLFVLRNRGEALRIVLPELFKNSQDSYLLIGDKKPQSLSRAQAALVPALITTRIYARDSQTNQFAGELYFFMYERDGSPASLSGAKEYYSRCTRLAPESAFCARRLSEILRVDNPAEADEMARRSRELDPFGLLDSGLLRRL
ncbi:MAG: O-antigen ligase family protein [Spirochaetia bacterium]|nr:O-antigen ligase family protein [Spirochaetia bacterium]